jgi:hypothetical protein
MGRYIAIDMLPRYREVLVATAVRAIRENRTAVQVFLDAAERHGWHSGKPEGGWRAVAVAAGAVPVEAILR